MADRGVEALLSYHCLTEPLHPNPVNDIDKIVNSLRLKYRTYIVEYEVDCGAVMMPTCFGSDFGDQIDNYATLIDRNNNQFEIKFERFNGFIFLTKGFAALRDFYGISLGAWLTLVYEGFGRFRLKKMKSRIKRKIAVPLFDPPMRFVVEKNFNPDHFLLGFPESIHQLSYRHDLNNFTVSYEKYLTASDITSGFLKLTNIGFCELSLDKDNTALSLIDDNGNNWDCNLVIGTLTQSTWRIGGEWKRMVDARRLQRGAYMIIGAPVAGNNRTVYFSVKRL